jgi:transposase
MHQERAARSSSPALISGSPSCSMTAKCPDLWLAAVGRDRGPARPFFGQQQVQLLCTIPGVQRRAAEVIIAETGADMTSFPTAKHLASWAGVCLGNDESAGKRRFGRTTKSSKWLRQTLTESAKAAVRT